MLSLLLKKNNVKSKKFNDLWSKLKRVYDYESLSETQKEFIKREIEEKGYLAMSQIQALEDLSDAQVLFGIEQKLKKNKTFNIERSRFEFEDDKISPLKRSGYKDSYWIKREQHNIKLINLAALGNGNRSEKCARFIDWLRQLLILPSGLEQQNIISTTIYLIPFHPREFGCAYLPTSSDVSEHLEDKDIKENLKLNAKEQVQYFINLAQLSGHPVIFDVLPQTGRFSKIVLSNPYLVRWYDIKSLIKSLEKEIDSIKKVLEKEYNKEDVESVCKLYKQILKNGQGCENIVNEFEDIFNDLEIYLVEKKKQLSNEMLRKENQEILHKKVKKIVALVENKKSPGEIKDEKDIKNQGEVTQKLISEGLWPAPGGAWCSCGVPVFDKMSKGASFPQFKHFDIECKDVSEFANLDCQTPYYFVFLESGKYNYPVINFYIKMMKKLKNTYNFDGFRVDHIDHIVDKVSEKDGVPISYRAPRMVLGKMNAEMKKQTPYFATIAEYMLWDDFYKEYHQDMNFDLLWGNDIICQSSKNPQQIIDDNLKLELYNENNNDKPNLSIIKTYNNQDGEFKDINQYPGQLCEKGALFKWFKYKFLPGGKNAQRPIMYIDGDESFTKTGMEGVIGAEVSMMRNRNDEFFFQFDAINRFALSSDLLRCGQAQMITQDDDGFCAWVVSKEPDKNSLLIAANYLPPAECIRNEQTGEFETKYGHNVFEKTVTLPCDYKIIATYTYDNQAKNFVESAVFDIENEIIFHELLPSEFKIYKVIKK